MLIDDLDISIFITMDAAGLITRGIMASTVLTSFCTEYLPNGLPGKMGYADHLNIEIVINRNLLQGVGTFELWSVTSSDTRMKECW